MLHWIRHEKVILDYDRAALDGVETRVLKRALRRNRARFPDDFLFELTRGEVEGVRRSRSQPVILKRGENLKYLPYAFTEQGVAMLSSILRSSGRGGEHRDNAPNPNEESDLNGLLSISNPLPRMDALFCRL